MYKMTGKDTLVFCHLFMFKNYTEGPNQGAVRRGLPTGETEQILRMPNIVYLFSYPIKNNSGNRVGAGCQISTLVCYFILGKSSYILEDSVTG